MNIKNKVAVYQTMGKSFKTQCQELRNQGLSLNEIVIATKRSKTSVYFHIRNLPLSEECRHRWLLQSTERIVNINHARKDKSQRAFRKIGTWTTSTVELVAHLLFDGHIAHNGCEYYNRSKILIERVKNCFETIYDYPPRVYNEKGVARVCYYNVELADHLAKKSQELIREIETLPILLQRTFLRSFYDDEGNISFRGKNRSVRGYQHDINILNLVQRLLLNFDIKAHLRGEVEVAITGRQNIERFASEINFSAGVCVNGNRSNSIWKEHLEKREILRRALVSYQK